MKGARQVVIIGINEYSESYWPKLLNPRLDVEYITSVLTGKFGFDLEERLLDRDASRSKILDSLDNICKGHQLGDTMILYFAGHGKQDPRSGEGFWIPSEGTDEKSGWINHSSILETLKTSAASHILLISDSCFSGTFNTATSTITHYKYDQLEALNSRWILTSGRAEPVLEGDPGKGSPFSRILCDYLVGTNQEAVCVEEVFLHLQREMFDKYRQQPTFGSFDERKHNSGQLVFRGHPTAGRTGGRPIGYPKFPVPVNENLKSYIPRTVSVYNRKPSQLLGFEMDQEGLLLQNLITRENRLVILGGAGSGKSTEIVETTKKLQETPGQQIAIWATFRDYTGGKISDFLPKGWSQPPEDKLVLLLDSLDEIESTLRNIALINLRIFSNDHPNIRIICGCRTNLYELPGEGIDGALPGFATYKINPISIAQIKEYAKVQFEVNGEAFLQNVFENKLKDLVQIPFFLNILLETYKREGKLCPDRSRIMKDALFTQFNKNVNHYQLTLSPTLERPEMTALLTRIAFTMERLGRNYLGDDELYKLYPDSNTQQRLKFLPAFTHHQGAGRWQFDHNNLQEYLAAEALSSLESSKVLEIISLPGVNRLRPSWANTLTFYISIADEEKRNTIIQWMETHDPEFVVLFETVKLEPELRVSIAKRLLNSYNDRAIGLTSNKFGPDDLARFGGEDTFIKYLLTLIERGKLPVVGINNTINVLSYVQLYQFKDLKPQVAKTLLRLLETKDLNNYTIYYALRALGSLQVLTPQQLKGVITQFRRHKDEYIRAGLYKLLIDSQAVDQYLSVLLEGMDIDHLPDAIEDRKNINLVDETFLLTQALLTIQSPDSVNALLIRARDNFAFRQLLARDEQEVLVHLINKCIELYPRHSELFEPILRLWTLLGSYFDERMVGLILPFFQKTGTCSRAFWAVWVEESINMAEKMGMITGLLNESIILEFAKRSIEGEVSEDGLKAFHSALVTTGITDMNGNSMARALDAAVSGKVRVYLDYPTIVDRRAEYEQRAQEAFDLLFDMDQMMEQIASIFTVIKKLEIVLHDIVTLRQHTYRPGGPALRHSAIEWLRLIIDSQGSVTNETASQWTTHNSFRIFRLTEAYRYLTGKKGYAVNLSPYQQKAIIEWTSDMVRDSNLEQVPLVDPQRMGVLWHCIQMFNISVPEEKLLSFTRYFEFRGSTDLEKENIIDQLGSRVDYARICERVIQNLRSLDRSRLAWAENASYGLRRQISEAFPLVTNYLLLTSDLTNWVVNLLGLLNQHGQSKDAIREIASTAASSWIRQESIKLLLQSRTEKDFVIDWSTKVTGNGAEPLEMKIFAANSLVTLRDIRGLDFLADIVETGINGRDLAHIGNLNTFETLDALPYLLRLFYQSKYRAPREDEFGFFDSRVTQALMDLGTISQAHFMAVKNALHQFQVKRQAELGELHYFSIIIQRMEETLLQKSAAQVTLAQAVQEYDRYFTLTTSH